MRQNMSIELPDGFQLIERESTMDVLQARDLLLSRKKRNLTSAVRNGDEATVTWHVIECPYCRSQVPAYYRYVGKAPAVSRSTITTWAEQQYSLFENLGNKLIFNNVYNPRETYMCPRCKQKSRPFRGNNVIQFCAENKKLRISCKSTDLRGVLDLAKATKMKLNRIQLPLTEVLEFNMRNGHSSIRIKDRDDSVILVLDITSGGNDWRSTTIYKSIDTNILVKRKLRKAFGWVYEGKVPFDVNEISPANAVAMTRFEGFPKVFYDSVPYACSDEKIDPSFSRLAKKIRREQDLPIILEKSALPQAKSLRRIMFLSPGLFFYLPEIERLWEIINDINYFTRLLESSNAFVLLSFLHQYPGALIFLREYGNIKGTANLYALMSKNWREVADYSVHYCSMSSDAQRKEHDNWKHVKSSLKIQQGYSIPMPAGSKAIKDCTIDGFSFEWLRTKNDYIRTGTALNNCLKEWTPYSNPVVAVKTNSRAVAAIEIHENMIVQAKGANNMPIRRNKHLSSAYEQWKKRYALLDVRDSLFFDFDE